VKKSRSAIFGEGFGELRWLELSDSPANQRKEKDPQKLFDMERHFEEDEILMTLFGDLNPRI
jgi:hypothetical protein